MTILSMQVHFMETLLIHFQISLLFEFPDVFRPYSYDQTTKPDGIGGQPRRTNLWGPDLSGTSQGAGGVGGLIAVREFSLDFQPTYFCAYDGNGNIVALVDSSDGTIGAQ